MRRTRGNTQMQENHENAFNLSISDLMAGMLSVFILAVCYFMLNLGQVKDQYMGNNAKRDQLLEEIQEEMSERGISVKIDKKQGVLRIPEGALFAQGEADVKEEGQQVIRNLGDVLYQLLDKKEYKNVVETVFIEGHTDNVDIHTDDFPSNWELSTKRAINTWNLMRGDVPELDREKNANEQPIFSCSGYADTRPIVDDEYDEDSEEGRQANRRIDLRFTMMPPVDESK